MLIRPVYRPLLPSLAKGLVGWWPFDDAARAPDYSGTNNMGIPISTPVAAGGIAPAAPGRYGRGALKFDGSTQFVETTKNWGSTPPTSFTLATWFKSTGNAADLCGFNDTQDGSGSTFDRSLSMGVVANGKIDIYIFDGGSQRITSTNTYNDGNWHHAVATCVAGSTLTLYVDGLSVASKAVGTPYTGYGTSYFVIAFGHSTNAKWNGSLDDVRLYNRALAAGEVLALYAEAFQPQINIETIALMHGTYAAGGATPWLYVQNNFPVIGAGTY